MTDDERSYFDALLSKVLEALPERARAALGEVSLIVEDHPSDEIMEQMGLEYRDELCGLYTGIPITERSIEHTAILSDTVHIYREGLFAQVTDDGGALDEAELCEQMRLTVMHELGHYYGFDEERLDELGY